MTVVVVGREGKREFELLADAVEDRGGEVVFWNTNDWPSERPVTYDVGRGTVTVDRTYDAADVTGVYAWAHHLFDVRVPPLSAEVAEHGLEETANKYGPWRGVFNAALSLFAANGASVFTPPPRQHHDETKPLQLTRFDRAGVPVPDTLITNDPDRLRAFADRHGEIVYKPVTDGAAPSRLSASDLSDAPLDRLANAPVQFQEYVPGDDLRVYVLDGEVVGASRYVADEWTFKHVPGDPADAEAVDLRPSIREAVERAAAVSPLRFGAADVRATDDSFALLELNSDPRFAFHDVMGATDIAGVLADELVG